jgi:hypothetical protein
VRGVCQHGVYKTCRRGTEGGVEALKGAHVRVGLTTSASVASKSDLLRASNTAITMKAMRLLPSLNGWRREAALRGWPRP